MGLQSKISPYNRLRNAINKRFLLGREVGVWRRRNDENLGMEMKIRQLNNVELAPVIIGAKELWLQELEGRLTEFDLNKCMKLEIKKYLMTRIAIDRNKNNSDCPDIELCEKVFIQHFKKTLHIIPRQTF
jgi:hypothetical protein